MEKIVNSIISNYLANYLEINPEKTKLSVLSGTVDLSGVKFKKNLFTTLNLPYLELVDGYVGNIHVNLSLPRFYLYPINVQVSKIYVKVKPKNMNKIQDEEILKTFEIYKKKKLKQFEELMNIKLSLLVDNEEEKNEKKDKKDKKDKKNKKQKLTILENIINNLHIKIQEVVLIFDDCVSNPKYPVTLGVSLYRIFIDSTSKNFNFNQLSEEEKMSPLKYKKLSIENLNIFLDNLKDEDIFKKDEEFFTKLKIREEVRQKLNEKEKTYLGDSIDFYLYCESEMQYYSKDPNYHSYLMKDLNPEIRLIINEKFYDEKNKDPQISGTVDIKTITLEVSNKQIKALTNTLNYISLKNFYQQTTIENHFNKVEKIDNDLIKNYLEEYSQYYKTKYIEIYKNEKENKKFAENMETLEKNLRLDNITALREMGNEVINNMIEIGKIDKEIKTSRGGFLGKFKSKNSSEIDKLKIEREKKLKEQKEIQLKNSTLNKFKDYVSGMFQNSDGDKSKEDKIEFFFNFLMENLNLIIKEEEKGEKMKKIFEINFIKFETLLIIKTISQYIRLTLKDMKFSQFLSENKNYEKILYSENINSKQKCEDISLISVDFEHNIKLPISPFKFRVLFGKQMFIIFDYYYFYYLYNLFLKHISALDFNNLSSLVNDKITSIVKVGYDNLVKNREIQKENEEDNTKLFNIHVDISLMAPILLFPLYFRDVNNNQMLYISLGILKIKSQLADTNDEKAIYDKYIVDFSNFIMKTIDIYNIQDIIKDDIGEKIIDRSSFNLELQNYIYKTRKKIHKTEDFSPLLVNINLNDIKFSLCEEQIIFLINYLENFLRTKNEFEKERLIKMEKKKQNQITKKIPLFQDDDKNPNKENIEKKDKIPLFTDGNINQLKDNKEKKEIIPLFKDDNKNQNKENKQKKDIIPLFKDDTKNQNKEKKEIIPLFKDDNKNQIKDNKEKKDTIPLFEDDMEIIDIEKIPISKEEEIIISEENKKSENEIKKDTSSNEENEKEMLSDDKLEKIENKEKEIQEVVNVVKLSIKFGSVNLVLIRNLDKTKKIKFLTFLFEESFLDLLMKSNGSINMEISFGHFHLRDEDLKINPSTKKEEPQINPEFRFIAGTTFFDFKAPKENEIKLSEIYNYKKEKNNNEGETSGKQSIKIELKLNAVTNQIDVYITMCKLTISPNFSTILRAYTFLFKYLDIFNQSFINLKFEHLKDEMEDKNPKKLEDNSAAPNVSKEGKDQIKDKSKDTILKSREKSTMNIFFSMEGINILFPIDNDLKNTHIIFMALEMPISYVMRTDAELYYKDSQLMKIHYLMKTMQLSIYIKEGNFSIYEYKDDFLLFNNKNKFIDGVNVSLLMNNSLDNDEKASKYDLKIYLNRDTELSININQIIIFLDLIEKLNEFLKALSKQEDNKIVLNKKQEFMDDDDFKRAVKNSIIKARENQEEFEKEKRKQNKQFQDINYESIFTYDIIFSNFFIKFYDIIDGIYQTLFEFSMKNTKVDLYQNSNPKDSTNLREYLKNTFSPDAQNKKKLDTYDKNNFYMYFQVLTNIEVKFLNNYLNELEYFIEPFKLEFYFCQFLKRMRPNIKLFIKNIINFNISLNFAKILQFAIKRFSLKKEELKIKKEEISLTRGNINTSKYIDNESPVLILENYSGVDMEIFFDNISYNNDNKDLIIRIKSNEKYEITSNILNKYKIEKKNNNLNCTISYKFCVDENLVKDMNIEQKNLKGNNFNVNYHQIIIHNISNKVKVSIESFSDNLLIRHIVFSSLISLKNETKYQDIEIYNNIERIKLIDKKRQTIPISWLIEIRNPSLILLHEGDKQTLIKKMSEFEQMSRVIKFKNGDVIMIDIIKYKLNLKEYYLSKNIIGKKEDLYRIDIIITSPINLINNTPYDFFINTNEKIPSLQSLSSKPNNSSLLLEYRQKINEHTKKLKNNKNEIIMRILKDINFQIFYNNKYISADTYIIEKKDEIEEENNEEGKTTTNFNLYNKSTLILLKNNNLKEYLVCRLILNNPYKSLLFDNKSYESMNIELNSFRYEIIFDYYLVNKSFNKLYFNNKPIDLVKASKEELLILPKQFLPLSKILLHNKIKFRKTQKDWSDNFEYTALGKEFVLNVKNENKTYNALSVIAKLSTTFKKSITFVVEEKFIVINELPFNINIKEDKLQTVLTYRAREANVLLLDKETLGKKSFFRVGIHNCFSHIFDPSKLGTYDLLIFYEQKTFENLKIDTTNKLVEYDFKKYFPIRCVINTINKNTIYIIFSLNHQYVNQLRNCTPLTIQVFVHDNKTKKFLVRPERTIPLVYINKDDKYKPFENIKIVFNEDIKANVSINDITTKYCGDNKDYYIRIQPEKNNSVKSITLFGKRDRRLFEDYYISKRIKKYTTTQGGKIWLDLEGIGFSLIDETPKEIFYISFYKIFLNYSFSSHNNILNETYLYNSMTFSLKNLEIDYCLENSYDIIFNPVNQILPPKPGEIVKTEKNFLDKVMEVGNEDTPFIQLVMSQKKMQEKIDNKIKILYTIFPEFAIIIQEFDVRINTILINYFIHLITQYLKIFLSEGENNNEMDVNKINKEQNTLIEDENKIINEIRESIYKKGEDASQLIVNYLTLSAIKSNTTFKINKNAIDIKFMPEIFVTILNTLCSSLTSFSEVTIKLKEFTFVNVFSDYDSLYTKFFIFYKNELLAQLYKIIFNMDLIGNPVNLIEGIGTGFFEFFNEPRKGLLKGPEEFGLGIAKGTRSLVSNIVGGSFKSASKITGSLLNVTKNLSSLGTEEEVVVKEEEKPRGLLKGTISGFKKGFGELAHGVTGIVTKPIEQSKKSGVGGFFKGLGSGLLGAVLSPVNSVLTVSNEVTTGISNSELISNKKSLRRFRLPRTLYKYIPINPYNEEEEIKIREERKKKDGKDNAIVSLNNEFLCLENSTKIIGQYKLKEFSTLIFTDIMIKIFDKNLKYCSQKIYICNIGNVSEKGNEVQLTLRNNVFQFLTFMNQNEQNYFIKEINKYLK